MSVPHLLDSLPECGMPPLDDSAQRVGWFEFWPSWLFYAPVPFVWAWLSLRHGSPTLPTAANPGLPFGGLMGESKTQVLDQIGGDARRLVPRYITIERTPTDSIDAIVQRMADMDLVLPCVAKPDLGCRGAGVQLLRDRDSLERYWKDFPTGARFILQEWVDWLGEAGVLYARHPEEKTGRILSLTLKYFPHVRGDGKATLGQLIDADPRAGRLNHLYKPRFGTAVDQVIPADQWVRLCFSGSHSKGAIFRNGADHITPAMTDCFDALSHQIDGFYLGRFDVRFRSFDDFKAGRDFRILEVNGAGAEATHIWDSRTKLPQAWATILGQWRLLFDYGATNRRRGAHPSGVHALITTMWQEKRLAKVYPSTH